MQIFEEYQPSKVQNAYDAFIESLSHYLKRSQYILEVNEEVRIVSILSSKAPHILAQQQFTRNEWTLLVLLIQYYPRYVPHEMLLASLTAWSEEECRQRLQESQHAGPEAVKREFRPVYRSLAGIRTKLGKLSPQFKISLVRCSGYMITISS